MRGVRKNRYREATRTLQSGVPDNLRGCWSRLYPKASRSKYQSIKKKGGALLRPPPNTPIDRYEGRTKAGLGVHGITS